MKAPQMKIELEVLGKKELFSAASRIDFAAFCVRTDVDDTHANAEITVRTGF